MQSGLLFRRRHSFQNEAKVVYLGQTNGKAMGQISCDYRFARAGIATD